MIYHSEEGISALRSVGFRYWKLAGRENFEKRKAVFKMFRTSISTGEFAGINAIEESIIEKLGLQNFAKNNCLAVTQEKIKQTLANMYGKANI